MTLVVARRTDNTVLLLSDTKVTSDLAIHPSLLDGALKTIIVSPTVCVSFAGNTEVARDSFAGIFSNQLCGRAAINAHLLDCHIRSGQATDFVIASLEPTVSLDRIAAGLLEHGLQSTWIGSHAAFEAFQELAGTQTDRMPLASPSFDPATTSALNLRRAFADLVESSQFSSVGNFTIFASSGAANSGGFRYAGQVFGSGFHPVENTTEPTSMTRSLGVEGGSFHYSLLTPTNRGVGAIAIHIYEAQIGVLLYPRAHWEPTIFRDVSVEGFVELIAATFGVVVDGIRVS